MVDLGDFLPAGGAAEFAFGDAFQRVARFHGVGASRDRGEKCEPEKCDQGDGCRPEEESSDVSGCSLMVRC